MCSDLYWGQHISRFVSYCVVNPVFFDQLITGQKTSINIFPRCDSTVCLAEGQYQLNPLSCLNTHTGNEDCAQAHPGHQSLALRTAQYVDSETRYVDINNCVAGAHARALKPGGIEQITISIRADGYKRVPFTHNY